MELSLKFPLCFRVQWAPARSPPASSTAGLEMAVLWTFSFKIFHTNMKIKKAAPQLGVPVPREEPWQAEGQCATLGVPQQQLWGHP